MRTLHLNKGVVMANLDFIYKRKSIRKFKNQSIPKEDILTLLDAATHAPSPKNQQNWHFVVLQNRDIIKKLTEIVSESHIAIAEIARSETEKTHYMKLLKYYTLFQHAPVVIIVYANDYDMIEYDILKANGASEERLAEIMAPQSAAQGIGAAVENFLLAATEMGYGACYMTGPTHAKNRIEALINFDKPGYHLMSLIALGVPEENTPPAPKRKPLEEVVTFID